MATKPVGRDSAAAARLGKVLHAHGLRRMPSRIAVLTMLELFGHMSVGEIHRHLSEAERGDGPPPDLATVYRTVTTLVERGILHTLTADGGLAKYGLIGDPHHHGVCTECGSITELSVARLVSLLEQVNEGNSFRLSEETSLTVPGLCGNCHSKDQRNGGRSQSQSRQD